MTVARTTQRGVAAGRSAQRACERSNDWRRGAASSPDPDQFELTKAHMCAGPLKRSLDPELVTTTRGAHVRRTYWVYSPDPFCPDAVRNRLGLLTHRKENLSARVRIDGRPRP